MLELLELAPNDLNMFSNLVASVTNRPALTKGVEMMCTPEYEKADLLVISDFVMSGLPEEVANAIESRKMLKNRFFALTVESGGSAWNRYESSQLFDGAWQFDALRQDVVQLNEHMDSLIGV